MKFRQTDRKKELLKGVVIILILISTPFLFYIYTFAPFDSKEWDTVFGRIGSGGFDNVKSFLHALFTKITFVILTTIWFLSSKNWWKYAILVPLTMFLFQLSGVVNYQLQFIDEYDFWYSLPFILPILFFLILLSVILSKKKSSKKSLNEDAHDFVSKMFSDEL